MFNRILSVITLALALAFSAFAQCPAIDNFAKVDEHLYRGAEPVTECQFQQLRALGIVRVLDLRNTANTKLERVAAEASGLQYINVPRSGWRAPTVGQMRVELMAIATSPGPVFVHCKRGRDRTGTVVAVYRIEHGWSATNAIREMQFQHNFFGYFNMRNFVRNWQVNPK